MRRHSRTILSAWACLVVTAITADVSVAEIYVDVMFDTQKTSNIVYGQGATLNGDIPLVLDIYEPVGVGAPAVSPLIVVIHGGGFKGGSKTNTRSLPQAKALFIRFVCTFVVEIAVVSLPQLHLRARRPFMITQFLLKTQRPLVKINCFLVGVEIARLIAYHEQIMDRFLAFSSLAVMVCQLLGNLV